MGRSQKRVARVVKTLHEWEDVFYADPVHQSVQLSLAQTVIADHNLRPGRNQEMRYLLEVIRMRERGQLTFLEGVNDCGLKLTN